MYFQLRISKYGFSGLIRPFLFLKAFVGDIFIGSFCHSFLEQRLICQKLSNFTLNSKCDFDGLPSLHY
jgi:hypothetical protein